MRLKPKATILETSTEQAGIWTRFVRLYKHDQVFRGSFEMAILGLIVLMFILPLPSPWAIVFPSVIQPKLETPNVVKPDPIRPTIPMPESGIAKLKRDYHHLSQPQLAAALAKIEEAINLEDKEQARVLLSALPKDSNDPNVLFYRGIVERDKATALGFWERSAELGHPGAMNNFAAFLPASDPRGLQLLKRAAALGEASAAQSLANRYRNGVGVPVDEVKGAHYTAIAAAKGDSEAMSNLGALYQYGKGVAPDPVKALHWHRRAAFTGHPVGQYNYALALLGGIGGKPDVAGFEQWAKAAADKGLEHAMYRLGVFYARPDDGRPPDFSSAASYLEACAAKNSGRCLAALGVLTERGNGVAKNEGRALQLYEMAVRYGHVDATRNLEALKKRLGR